MKNAFVFVVWSDNQRWEDKIKTELNKERGAKKRIVEGITGYGLIQKLGGVVYGFGDECCADLRSYGLKPIQMTDDSENGKTKEGQFRKRYLALADAFEKYDHVVSLDIDCIMQMAVLPKDFWQRLASGPPMQYPLVGPYTRPKSVWRDDPGGIYYTSTSCWFYMRDKRLAADMLTVMDAHHGVWSDEHGAAWLIDQEMGGWKGTDGYKAAGYDPPFVTCRYQRYSYAPTPFAH